MFRDNNQSNLVSSNIISYSHDNIDIVAKIKFKGKRKRKYKNREEKKIWKKMRRNEAKKKRIYSRAYTYLLFEYFNNISSFFIHRFMSLQYR